MITIANFVVCGEFRLVERPRVYRHQSTNARLIFGRSEIPELWELIFSGHLLIWTVQKVKYYETAILTNWQLEPDGDYWLSSHDFDNPNPEPEKDFHFTV